MASFMTNWHQIHIALPFCCCYCFSYQICISCTLPNKTELKRFVAIVPLFCCYLNGISFQFSFILYYPLLSCYLILIFCYLSAFLLSPASHPSHLKAISPVTGQTLYVSVNAFVQSPFYFFLRFIVFVFCVPFASLLFYCICISLLLHKVRTRL